MVKHCKLCKQELLSNEKIVCGNHLLRTSLKFNDTSIKDETEYN